jgi:PhnB protein
MSSNPMIERLNDAIDELIADPQTQLVSGDRRLMALLHLARELKEFPNPDFKDRLRSSLERNIAMKTQTVTFRPGFRTVTPYLLPSNADFLEFLKSVFGATETERTVTSPSSFHAEVRIGDSMAMVGVGSGRLSPAFLSIFVPDVDATYRRAVESGCTELEPVRDDYGDRFGCVEDPSGNQWCIATHLGESYIKENFNTLTVGFSVVGASRFVEFLRKAVDAEELERQVWPGGFYATIRVGDSVVTVSESTNHGWMKPLPTMLYLYVPDADASYERAIRAGATSIHPPTNHSYGDRNGGVRDEWGNQWYMATPL